MKLIIKKMLRFVCYWTGYWIGCINGTWQVIKSIFEEI